MRARYWLAFLGVLACLGAVASRRPSGPVDPRVLPASAVKECEHASNVLPGDYTGPEACAKCHAEQHDHWSKHSHRVMNQLPHEGSVKGDFSGQAWHTAGGAAVSFTHEADTYWMTVEQPGKARKRYKVTRTVGSRFMQFYVGVQTEGPEPPGQRSYEREHKLPFGYWFRLRRWLPVNYFDRGEPEKLIDGVPPVEGIDADFQFFDYRDHCLHCHNTYPYAYRIFRPDLVGFPDATVAAALEPLSQALSKTVPTEPNVSSLSSAPNRLHPDRDLVTMGISCESCHLGGREHARDKAQIRFAPTSWMLQVRPHDSQRPVTGERTNAASSTGVCAQCHSSQIPEYPNGAAIANSREATDMHKGACASQIRCVDCHEPHTAGVPSGGPTLAKHVRACVRCHSQYREPDKAAAHSRHPAAADVSCLDCHMARYNQGLDEVVRTHRIAAPVEKSMASGGFANACNLCHLDRSMNWTLSELERGWGRRMDSKGWAASYGGLDRAVGEAWLDGRDAMTRLVATQAYGRSPLGKTKLSDVLDGLNDPVPVNRAFATIAAERLLGRQLSSREIDVTAAPAQRKRQIEALLPRASAKSR
jgi:hypothetical protein